MTTPIDPRLERLLGGPDTVRLRERLCQKLRRGQTLTGTITLDQPTASEVTAVARLLGRSTGKRPAKLPIDLKQLEDTLVDAGLCTDLAEAVQQIEGAIHDERAQKDRASSAWDTMLAQASHAGQHIAGNETWLTHLNQSGLLRRLAKSDRARAGELLARAQRVLDLIPHRGITRQVLSAQQLGDSHALDPSQPVATLVLRAIALRSPDAKKEYKQVKSKPGSADERHALWESVGVYENDITRSVLTLNLQAHDSGLVAKTLALHAEHGQPCSLTLRHLIHHAPTPTHATVYLCENPAILAVAARRLGRDCPPMVCVDGQPGSATHHLLGLLKDAQCTLRYHGDFDWAGIRIANQIIQTYDARPWQMAERDYAQAIQFATLRLDGPTAIASWSTELSDRMQQEGLAIHEEMLIENLLQDLSP